MGHDHQQPPTAPVAAVVPDVVFEVINKPRLRLRLDKVVDGRWDMQPGTDYGVPAAQRSSSPCLNFGNKKGSDAHVAAERHADEENKQEGEEEQTVVELRMPRSSDFE